MCLYVMVLACLEGSADTSGESCGSPPEQPGKMPDGPTSQAASLCFLLEGSKACSLKVSWGVTRSRKATERKASKEEDPAYAQSRVNPSFIDLILPPEPQATK